MDLLPVDVMQADLFWDKRKSAQLFNMSQHGSVINECEDRRLDIASIETNTVTRRREGHYLTLVCKRENALLPREYLAIESEDQINAPFVI
ncbi:hypothetical protein N7490_007843 [Penicillium lividum]|nr:hypothetical protein N7490_007843 [Penicillium lividum]